MGHSSPLRYTNIIMKSEEVTDFICVLKTGKLLDHDIASNALKAQNIPFHKQLETACGLRLAHPFQPSMAPGTFYNLLVHPDHADEAKGILKNLPISTLTNPDIWDFGPSTKAKKSWKIMIWIFLSLGVLVLISSIVKDFV